MCAGWRREGYPGKLRPSKGILSSGYLCAKKENKLSQIAYDEVKWVEIKLSGAKLLKRTLESHWKETFG